MSYLLVEAVPDAGSGGGKAALCWDKAGIQVLWGALVFEQRPNTRALSSPSLCRGQGNSQAWSLLLSLLLLSALEGAMQLWLLLLVLKCRLPSYPSHIPTSLSDAQWPESSPCALGVSWCQHSSAACLPCDMFPPFSAENSARCRPRPPSPNLLGGTQGAASVNEHVPK